LAPGCGDCAQPAGFRAGGHFPSRKPFARTPTMIYVTRLDHNTMVVNAELIARSKVRRHLIT